MLKMIKYAESKYAFLFALPLKMEIKMDNKMMRQDV
jgi:hypothetical protein